MYPDVGPHWVVDVDCGSGLAVRDQAAARPVSLERLAGYARAAGDDDGEGVRQVVSSLQQARVTSGRIHVDRAAANEPRPFLAETLAGLSEGDRLLVPSLASLARSAGELKRIVEHLDRMGVQLWVGGTCFAALSSTEVVALMAVMMADLRLEAEREDKGRQAARQRDGRSHRHRLTAVASLEMREQFDEGAVRAGDLAARWGVSRATLFRAVGPALRSRPGLATYKDSRVDS